MASGLVVTAVACEAVLRDGEPGRALSFSVTHAVSGMLWHKQSHRLSSHCSGRTLVAVKISCLVSLGVSLCTRQSTGRTWHSSS